VVLLRSDDVLQLQLLRRILDGGSLHRSIDHKPIHSFLPSHSNLTTLLLPLPVQLPPPLLSPKPPIMQHLANIHGLVPDHFQVIGDLLRVFAELSLEVVRVYLLILSDDILVLREVPNELLVAVLEKIADDIQELQGGVNELRPILEILKPINEEVEYLRVLLRFIGSL